MCQGCECEHPERLESKPGECSPEQIFECHGIKQTEKNESKK
jgi:hypothetical protein